MSAIESGDADESMSMVKPGTEAWRLIHSRFAQNTTEMISGSLLHDHADKYNQLPDELPDELKEQKHPDNQRHELQPVDIRSLDEYRTKFRDEHNEITKTMNDLSIVQHQTESEEKADNEQQLRRELSMVAEDNDAKHGDVNLRQVAYQEDGNLKLQNENIQARMQGITRTDPSTLLTYTGDSGSEAQARIGSHGKERIQRNTVENSQFAIDL